MSRDIKTLIIPYGTFVSFLIICSLVLKLLSDGPGPIFSPLDENCYILYYTIWFLLCLFITRFLYRILYNQNILITTILCLMIYSISYTLKRNEINFPFFIDSAMSMLIFYHIGFLFRRVMHVKISVWYSLGLLLLYTFIVWKYNPHVDIKDNTYPIYIVLLSLMPVYALYQIFFRVHSRFICFLGFASLVIMGLHHPIYDVVMFPLINRLQFPQFIEITIVIILTLILCAISYYLLMRYTPFLLGKSAK